MKTTRMTKAEATAAIAAILSQVGASVDLDDVCGDAIDLAQRARTARQLRLTYRRCREPEETWEAFIADSVDVGEWMEEWGMPVETE